jgi:hypothetical protein
MDAARRSAFQGGIGKAGAYQAAKDNAKSKLDKLTEDLVNAGWTKGKITYTELTYQSSSVYQNDVKVEIDGESVSAVVYKNEKTTEGWFGSKTRYTECVVNVIGTITMTTPEKKTLYIQESGTGCWGDESIVAQEGVLSSVNTDELRIYSGNSFTISVDNENLEENEPEYKITGVKIYYSGSNSGSNHIKQLQNSVFMGTGSTKDAYARFVNVNAEGSLDLSSSLDQAIGMNYTDNSDNGGVHYWEGLDTESVTLELADYVLTKNLVASAVVSSSGNYQVASVNKEFYLVIDKIEVKCVPIE